MEKTSNKKLAGYEIPTLTVRDMLRPLFRHRLVMLTTFSTVFLASIVVARDWASHYWVATMQVVVGRERLEPAVTPQPTAAVQATSKVVTTDDVDSEVVLLQGRANLYLQKHLRLQRPAGTLDFFAEETDRYQRALAESEKQLVRFSATGGVAAPEILRANLAQQLVLSEAGLHQARQTIAADQQRIENLRN